MVRVSTRGLHVPENENVFPFLHVCVDDRNPLQCFERKGLIINVVMATKAQPAQKLSFKHVLPALVE